MSSLLEAAAAIAIAASVLATMVASLASAARLEGACLQLGDELFERRQLEHLVDRAALAAGAGPQHPAAVSSIGSDTVVFGSDQNGDGKVDTTSSETTALEVRQVGSSARVRVKFGRQTMTVLEESPATTSLRAVDRSGRLATAASATLIELAINASDTTEAVPRRLLFAVPARSGP